MPKKSSSPSQVMELFLHVAQSLGASSERELAELADVSVENVGNWKSGTVRELKPVTLNAIKDAIAARVAELTETAGASDAGFSAGLVPIEIEIGSSPADLLRQLRERVVYDYVGHRFLYFDPPGALAWESLVRGGYEQDRWLEGVQRCAQSWIDEIKSSAIELIGLGPGSGEKETMILERLLEEPRRSTQVTCALIDVSIPLLLTAAQSARTACMRAKNHRARLRAVCADFEDGPLGFVQRLPSSSGRDGRAVRLVVMLGNIFGNVRDEETFVRQKLLSMVRPHDLLWIEVGIRTDRPEHDPLFRLTQPTREETAAEANRRLLLEGPYRRWEAASGRPPSALEMRVWTREDDDSCRIPGSLNFCHDLVLKDERRVCTMLYSRRYDLDRLVAWLERFDLALLRTVRVEDSKGRARVAHLLLRRRG
jgi:uncharacterized SAM-dependent methyltransferase